MTDTTCYTFERLHAEYIGQFDKYVDMVYLMTLEGSSRTEDAITRMISSKVSSKMTVQYNKGYRCEHKNLTIKASYTDITHALGNIFKHAKRERYKNILVLEDDFIFDSNYYTRGDVDEIGRFVTTNDFQIYNIGSMPILSYPVSWYHRGTLMAPPAHSVIYNESYFPIYHAIVKDKDYNIHCDSVPDLRMDINSYTYYKPICFQTFPVTENQGQWTASSYVTPLVSIVGLDTSYENYQVISTIIAYLNDILIIFILYTIYAKLRDYKYV
jgi:hypothetical protein